MPTPKRLSHVDIGATLREFRLKANLSQADLARRLGKPQSYVSKYETAEKHLDVVEVDAICQSVGRSLHDLLAVLERRRT